MTDQSSLLEKMIYGFGGRAKSATVESKLRLLNVRFVNNDLDAEDLANALKKTKGQIEFDPNENPPFRRVIRK